MNLKNIYSQKFYIKISSQIFFTGLLSLLLILIPLYFFSAKEILRINEREITSKANIISEDIEKLIIEKVKMIITLANSKIVIDEVKKSNKFYEKIQKKQRIKLIDELDKKWRSIENINNPFILKYVDNKLAKYLKFHERIFPKDYGEIFVTNKYGALVASTSKLTTFKHDFKLWWKECYNNGKGSVFIDDRGYDNSSKAYVIGIVVPIFNENRTIIGILKANIKIISGISLLLKTHLSPDFNIKIIRSKGRIIYEHGVTPLKYKVESEIIKRIKKNYMGAFLFKQYLIGYSIIDFDDTTFNIKFGGTPNTIDHSFGNEGEMWFTLIYMPKKIVYYHLNRIAKIIFILGLTITIILALLSFLIGKEAITPIHKIIKLCRNIAKGDFKSRIEINRNDEIGLLATTINEMAEKLDKTTTSKILLEKEIERRKKSEERLKDILRISPVVIYELDYDTLEFNWISENVEKLLGIKSNELIENYKIFLDHIHNEDRFILDSIKEICSKGVILREYRFLRDNGDTIWLHDETILIRGKVDRIIGAITDFTTHKKMTKELYEKEQKFKILFENYFEGVLILKENKIVDCNKTAVKIFNCKKENLIGINIESILVNKEDNRKKLINKLNDIQKNKSKIFTLIFHRKNGEEFISEVSISPIKIDGEEFVILSFRDITDKLKYEENLRQVAKLEAIGALTSGIAHDFNNILTIISGSIEIAKQSINNKAIVEKSLENAMKAVQRATNLIYKLLAFARKQPLFPKPINLVNEVKELEGLLKKLIYEDINLTFEYHDDNIIIFFDKSQLEQILVNLVVNARDAVEASHKKDKKITVKIEKVNIAKEELYNLKEGEYAKISVIDNGVGMSKEVLNRIFEPFFTTKKLGEGTGLGLSTVHGIVYQNKGAITVHSEIGKGTEFEIYLPIYKEIKEKIEEDDVNKELPKGKETILIIEDEYVVRDILKLMLESLGYNLIVASNGKEGLEIYKDRYPEIDLIISDIIMPEMDGKALYEKIIKINPNVKILYISGYPDNVLTAKGIDIKGENFIQKPVTLETLAKKIRDILSK